MIRGAIFDLDGTLLDSMSIWDTIGEDYLRSLGIEPRENLQETFATFTLEQAARYYQEHYGVALSVPEILRGIEDMVASAYRQTVPLKAGAADFLRVLKERGVSLCVATVTPEPLARAALRRLNVLPLFRDILTCAAVGHGKEEPHIYRAALERLQTETVRNRRVRRRAARARHRPGGWLWRGRGVRFARAAPGGTARPGRCFSRNLRTRRGFLALGGPVKASGGLGAPPSVAQQKICEGNKMKTALSIAGSDSCAGAGIQADLKTMAMNGVYATTAITALTAQNTTGVAAILEVPPEFLAQQLDAVFADIPPDAVKTGMIPSAELMRVAAQKLAEYGARNVVIDPVMAASSGPGLMQSGALAALTDALLPLAALITPNIPEAQALSGKKIDTKAGMEDAARQHRRALRLRRFAQGRAPGRGRQRCALRKRCLALVCGRAHCQSQFPRHGLHAFQRHRGQFGEGLPAGGCRGAGQGIPARRARGRAEPRQGFRAAGPYLRSRQPLCPIL